MIANTRRFRTYKLGTISLLANKYAFEELDEELELKDKNGDNANSSNDCDICGILNGASDVPASLTGIWKPYTLYIHAATYDAAKASLASINSVLSQARQRPLLNPPIALTKCFCTEINATQYVVIDGRTKLIDQFVTTNDLGSRFVIKAEMRIKTLASEAWGFTDDSGNMIPGVCTQPVLFNLTVMTPTLRGAGTFTPSAFAVQLQIPVPVLSFE